MSAAAVSLRTKSSARGRLRHPGGARRTFRHLLAAFFGALPVDVVPELEPQQRSATSRQASPRSHDQQYRLTGRAAVALGGPSTRWRGGRDRLFSRFSSPIPLWRCGRCSCSGSGASSSAPSARPGVRKSPDSNISMTRRSAHSSPPTIARDLRHGTWRSAADAGSGRM